jgi:hypothetical protein
MMSVKAALNRDNESNHYYRSLFKISKFYLRTNIKFTYCIIIILCEHGCVPLFCLHRFRGFVPPSHYALAGESQAGRQRKQTLSKTSGARASV